ncbi:MAG: RBBP9/YdeN family alpha/beta hydrolase [Bacteroidota bacterium]
MNTVLILPGIGSSGPDHWQTRWEKLYPSFRRVEQQQWNSPRCEDWVRTLDVVISLCESGVILVGHSSACALVAHWARQARPEQLQKVCGALLVGPSDPTGPNYPIGPTGFAPMPMHPLPFRSTVVASTDDIYVSLEQAKEYAAAWKSDFVELQQAGHINAASGLGDWKYGLDLLKDLQDID